MFATKGPAQRAQQGKQAAMRNMGPNYGRAMPGNMGAANYGRAMMAPAGPAPPVMAPGYVAAQRQVVNQPQLAAIVGEQEASCLSQPKMSYIAEDHNVVQMQPILLVKNVTQTVMRQVITRPTTEIVMEQPVQMQLNTGCPVAMVQAPQPPCAAPCASACDSTCNNCFNGPYVPDGGVYDIAAAAYAPQLNPFGYGYNYAV